MAQAPQEEFPPASEVDPYKVAEVPPPPQQGTDLAKYLLQKDQQLMKDLEAQRVRTALNAEQRKSILGEQETAEAPAREAAIGAMRERETAAEEIAKQPIPSIPQPPKLGGFLNKNIASAMLGIGSLVAGFNSSGKVRGIRANQSLAGAINGYTSGNLLQAQLGLEDWRNQVEAQLAEFKMVRQRNLDILEAKGMKLEDKMREIQLVNAPYMNKYMQAKIDQEGIDGVLNIDKDMVGIIGQMEKTLNDTDPVMRSLDLRIKQAQAGYYEARTKAAAAGPGSVVPQGFTPAAPGEKNEALLSQLDPATAELVKKMANYELPVSGFGGMDIKTRTRLLQLAALYDPSFDVKNYQTRQRVANDYSPAGPSGRNIVAINTMAHHIDDFAKAFGKLNNTQVQAWNSAANKLKTNFGDKAISAVQLSANAVADEMAKILKGGTASPTDQEMAIWEKIFTTSMSEDQMKTTVWQALQTAGGRLSVLEDAYKNEMGKPKNALYPDTQEIINRYKPKGAPSPRWLSEQSGTSSGTTPKILKIERLN